MSNSQCHKTSNNKYFDCRPRMDDGRHFTDYRANCHTNNVIRTTNKTFNSFQYRMFLTHNAEKIMEMNRSTSCEKNCCGPCQKPYNQGTMLPESSQVECNARDCQVKQTNPEGIGQGRTYGQSQHCANWPEQLPTGNSSNCCTPSEDNFRYHPVDTNLSNHGRTTSPAGGDALSGGDNSYYS